MLGSGWWRVGGRGLRCAVVTTPGGAPRMLTPPPPLNHRGAVGKCSQLVLGSPISPRSHSPFASSQNKTSDILPTVTYWHLWYRSFQGVSGLQARRKPPDGQAGIFWHLPVERKRKEESPIRLNQGELTKARPGTCLTKSFLPHVYMSTDYVICSQSLSRVRGERISAITPVSYALENIKYNGRRSLQPGLKCGKFTIDWNNLGERLTRPQWGVVESQCQCPGSPYWHKTKKDISYG